MKSLRIDAALISGQVYPRLFDFIVLNSLVMVTSALAKFAGDLRILQSPLYGEWSEPFGKKSSWIIGHAIQKNPISSENICSLARLVAALPKQLAKMRHFHIWKELLMIQPIKELLLPKLF